MFRHIHFTGIFVTLSVVALAQTPIVCLDVPPAEERVQFITTPNSDVKDVLSFYQKLTGRRVILNQTTAGLVAIDIAKKVPKEEAARIIEIALLKNGIALIPTKTKDVWKAFPVGKFPGKSAPIYSREDQLTEGDQVVSFLFELKYAAPSELAQTLGKAFPSNPDVNGGDFTALPKSGALLATAKTSAIRQIIRIVQEFDHPPSNR